MLDNSSKTQAQKYRTAYNFLETTQEIDINDPGEEIKILLEDIQGNILKGHGRSYLLYLFLWFNSEEQLAAKKWIKNFAHNYVTSAIKQRNDSQIYKQHIEDIYRKYKDDINLLFPEAFQDSSGLDIAEVNYKRTLKYINLKKDEELSEINLNPAENLLFVNFALSMAGYETLGFSNAKKQFLHLEFQKLEENQNPEKFLPNHPFEVGMKKNKKQDLKDKDGDWEKDYEQDIHALILLADNDPDNLYKEAESIIKEIAETHAMKILKKETGFVRRNNNNQVIEPFGFPDNISQPLFFRKDIEIARKSDKVGENWNWNPSATLRLVLNIDPFGKQFQDNSTTEEFSYSFGSFLVYRKLEQNVDGFNNRVIQLASKLEGNEGNSSGQKDREALARAFVVGRFREDGRPVALYGTTEEDDIINNNFNYGTGEEFKVKSGFKCPFHAHIRKVNPRGIQDKVFSENYESSPTRQRNSRIVRRGVSYGLPKVNGNSLFSPLTQQNIQVYKRLSEKLGVKTEEGNEGLLFICFQSDITNQFMKLQDYSNDKDFGTTKDGNFGIDPLTGQEKEKNQMASREGQKWPKSWGSKDKEVLEFWGYVTPRGGEYFFTPSLSFLKSL